MFEEPRFLDLLEDAATWSAKRMVPCAESETAWSASSERPPERMTWPSLGFAERRSRSLRAPHLDTPRAAGHIPARYRS